MCEDSGASEERLRADRARLREGNAIAATLIGLTAAEASDQIEKEGYVPNVIPPGYVVTADLAPHRIRLVIDESGVVTRAWGG
jgi:Potato inhibitor I family